VTFAVGALALSGVMAGITYLTARAGFLNERQAEFRRQAFVNASLVQNSLRVPGTAVGQLLESVDTLPGSRSVLATHGQWFATSISVGQSQIPPAERSLVLSGTAASQTFTIDATPEVVVGVPLPGVGAAYFEVFSLEEVERTLRTLALTLAIAAGVTTLAGAAVGRWAAGRALRPLRGVSDAAVAIAAGDLGTRVDAGDDADLSVLASSFNRMADHLQERIEREARFTSDVSHELRSPLTTLSASLSVLEAQREQLGPTGQRALGLLAGDLSRFTRMVSDLLEISRFDAGSAELSLDDVDAGELVRHALAAAMPPHGAAGPPERPVVVDVTPRALGLRVRVDKRRIERIVANLVDNARQYAGGARRVVVDAPSGPGARGPILRITVEDAGPGVAPDERGHLFERFYRGRSSGRRGAGEGTGLGLALVAEHARLHGGSVGIEDVPGGGARFVVDLPIDPEPGGPATDGARAASTDRADPSR
jgi:signal transduction histidine kinase